MSDQINPSSGVINSLWRYPIKSLLGEPSTSLLLDQRGVVGDRAFAIICEGGKIGSGKDTRRFGKIANLLSLQAKQSEDEVIVSFSNGRQMSVEDPQINMKLSAALGQTVKLQGESDVSHLDAAPLHIITTSSLAKLQRSLPQSQIDSRRFRANIIIDDQLNPLDSLIIGKTIEVGEAILRITEMTVRCVMVGHNQQELQNSDEMLPYINGQFGGVFGYYAQVLEEGKIRVGDSISIHEQS